MNRRCGRGILAYKFRNAPSRGKVFGRILGEDLLRRGADDFDLISWVPLSAKRCHRRGYDQAQLLAEAAAEVLEQRLCRCCAKRATFRRSPGCVLGGAPGEHLRLLCCPKCGRGAR